MNATQCRIDACESPAKYRIKQLCIKHYNRLRRLGTADLPAHPIKLCSIRECDIVVEARGWCQLHYSRWLQHGDPLHLPSIYRDKQGSAHPAWRGDAVGWAGAHRRLRVVRGKAAAYACVDCEGPAAEWSYDHSAPDERQGSHGPFSLIFEHYDPRCVRCHRRFDLGRMAADSLLHGPDDETTEGRE